MYNTFDKKNCVIQTKPGQPLTEREICFIVLSAFHGRRHSAILKLTLMMVGANSIKTFLLVNSFYVPAVKNISNMFNNRLCLKKIVSFNIYVLVPEHVKHFKIDPNVK